MTAQLQPPDHGDWTYEEQFKQVGSMQCWSLGGHGRGISGTKGS